MAGMQGHNASSHGFQPVRLPPDARATAPTPIGGLDDQPVAVPRAALLDMLHRLDHLTSDEFSKGGDRSVRTMLAGYAGVDVDDDRVGSDGCRVASPGRVRLTDSTVVLPTAQR